MDACGRWPKSGSSSIDVPTPVSFAKIASMNATNPYQPAPPVLLTHPEWSKNATIYQINTRQFTDEGTFRAAETHLPRLKDLGVVILWLMPINEIGEKGRKAPWEAPTQ